MILERKVDALIFGGGIAGLWTLDHLRREGYSALLVEKNCLGEGQTIVSQGIIHGGLKYALPMENRGDSVYNIKEMPEVWRKHLHGERKPDLTDSLKSEGCYLWVSKNEPWTKSFFLSLSTSVLNTKPINASDAPDWLVKSSDKLYFLPEPIVDSSIVLGKLASANLGRVIYGKTEDMQVEKRNSGTYKIDIYNYAISQPVSLIANRIILAAGRGNNDLARFFGLEKQISQEKPIRHVVLRGKDLPEFYGHCIEGGKAHITVTTHKDPQNYHVWNIGGAIADKGVSMEKKHFISHVKSEISRTLREVDFSKCQWGAFDATKIESREDGGRRPSGISLFAKDSIIYGWPTKLALAPIWAERVKQMMPSPQGFPDEGICAFDKPRIATAPWESEEFFSN